MAYADLITIQTLNTGDVLTAALMTQVRNNDEFFADPPACSIKETTAQSVANNTSVAMTADEESFDNDSMHSTASNTSRITIQTAGRYLCLAKVDFAPDADGHRVLRIMKNGATNYDLLTVASPTAVTGTILSGAQSLVLSAGDYLECIAAHTAGAALNCTLLEFTVIFITR